MTALPIAEVRKSIDAALSEVTAAESALEIALGELGDGPRAEKVAITVVVRDAFTRLRNAHTELTRLRDLINAVAEG